MLNVNEKFNFFMSIKLKQQNIFQIENAVN